MQGAFGPQCSAMRPNSAHPAIGKGERSMRERAVSRTPGAGSYRFEAAFGVPQR